jgi:DNA (cytosine-5)-methyltransferase 1
VRGGTVCSGIGAPEMAMPWVDWQFRSEIEAFPCAVMDHHQPSVPNLGDMTNFQDWPDADIDLLVGGTPCQSFSVAGLRKGLADPRGNLALTFLAIASKYAPRWILWENVPGVLSSDGGRDFGAFLGGLGQCGYGWAYRVLDAQYFGVPQRRRRVFVVGYLGDWRAPAAVLFERQSLSGNPAPRRNSGEGITASPGGIAGTVSSKWSKGSGGPAGDEHYNLIGGWDYENNAHGPDEPTGPLLKGSPSGGGRPLPAIAFAGMAQAGGGWAPPSCPTSLECALPLDTKRAQAVAFMENQQAQVWEADCVQALNKGGGKPGQGYPAIRQSSSVRRLTPRECERLQGFPDDFTLVPYRGKPAADGPRYKALGNSMAVPVVRWIGERIAAVEAIQERLEAA